MRNIRHKSDVSVIKFWVKIHNLFLPIYSLEEFLFSKRISRDKFWFKLSVLYIISNVSVNVSIVLVCGILLAVYQWGKKYDNSILKKKQKMVFTHPFKKKFHSLILHCAEKNARFSPHMEHIPVSAKGFHVKETSFSGIKKKQRFQFEHKLSRA